MMTQIQTDSVITNHLSICHALKEWAVAVNALEQGQTILLLRKGGIREEGGHFTVEHRQVLLYPTLEHQTTNLLKSEYTSQAQTLAAEYHSDQVKMSSFADITHIFSLQVPIADHILSQLYPLHIWTTEWVNERLNYKPDQPLYLLLLRTYLLPQTLSIPYDSTYKGCRSWIDLKQSISLENSSVVLSDSQYQQQVDQIQQILAP
jgi:hypothetical protein